MVLGAVYFCLFQLPFMTMFVFARWLHPLAAVLGTCLLLEDIFYFTPTKESTAGMNAGSEINELRGLCVVAWLLLLVLAWEFMLGLAGISVYNVAASLSLYIVLLLVVVWQWLLVYP